jgi:hypothetical protein
MMIITYKKSHLKFKTENETFANNDEFISSELDAREQNGCQTGSGEYFTKNNTNSLGYVTTNNCYCHLIMIKMSVT